MMQIRGSIRAKPWLAVLLLLGAFVMTNGLEALHLTLVPHRWCPEHGGFQHLSHPAHSVTAKGSEPKQGTDRVTDLEAETSLFAGHEDCVLLISGDADGTLDDVGEGVARFYGVVSAFANNGPQFVLATDCVAQAPKRSPSGLTLG